LPAAPHIGLDLLFLAPGDTGGMEIYARELVPLLPAAFPEARFTVLAGRELAAEWRRRPWHRDIGLVALPASSSTRIVRTAAQQSVVAGAALRAKVDLLHSLGNIAPLAGPRRVVTMHDLIYLSHPETTTGLLAKGLSLLAPAVAHRSARIIADSEATSRELQRLLSTPAQKIDVVPLGPGLPPATPPMDETRLRAELGLGDLPLVLSVSARRPHKNLVRLIEAVGRIPHAALVLPGYPSPAFEEELRATARAAGAEDRVHLCGWVDDAQLEGLYAAATCLAFPSLAEGFGLPVLEAMTRGVPVACGAVSALPEVAGDAALLFDPLSVDAIAAAIGHLLEDAALRARLVQRGYIRAAGFTWERTAQGTVASYERALGSSS
jgi:glycosyltransferase involved in cell wall biosynthesis